VPRYPGSSNARRITFEYIMLKGRERLGGRARELVRLIAGLPAKVNLIPFNAWPGRGRAERKAALERFAGIVNAAGLPRRYGCHVGRIFWRLAGSCGRRAGGQGGRVENCRSRRIWVRRMAAAAPMILNGSWHETNVTRGA